MTKFTSRTGPRPLWLHLNGGAAMMAAASDNADMFCASQTLLKESMNGVQHYQSSAVKPFQRDMDVIAEIKGTRVLTAKAWATTKQQSDKYVLLIPSLINGWEIFDIDEDHSFVAYLQSHGLTPLIIDWAVPKNDISIDDYVCNHLAPLIQQLQNNGVNIHSVIGYCMGATIIPALYSAFPDTMAGIKNTVLIAPPWDFSYQSAEQKMRLQSLAIQTHAMGNIVPNDFVQSLFWAIDPLQVIKKFRKFPNVKNPNRFVRVEDWLNTGRPVSKSAVQTCLFDWYRDNAVVNKQWSVNGKTVTQNALPKDTLIIAGDQDTLVPMASIKPLVTDHHELITVSTGHIGLMASDKAVKMWKEIAEFLK